MILTGPEIKAQHGSGRIRIEPFNPNAVTTNSYDVRLFSRLIAYRGSILDPTTSNPHDEIIIPSAGFLLRRHSFVLAATEEFIGSNHFVPILHARSSFARLGLFVHVTADLIDIGSFGRLTLQLFAVQDILLMPGMKLAQVSFWTPDGAIELYNGKYQGSHGPRASFSYMDERA